jgi:hypothetical protein
MKSYDHPLTLIQFSNHSLLRKKSTLLKIMAGIEKEFDGIARPLPGASIGTKCLVIVFVLLSF